MNSIVHISVLSKFVTSRSSVMYRTTSDSEFFCYWNLYHLTNHQFIRYNCVNLKFSLSGWGIVKQT